MLELKSFRTALKWVVAPSVSLVLVAYAVVAFNRSAELPRSSDLAPQVDNGTQSPQIAPTDDATEPCFSGGLTNATFDRPPIEFPCDPLLDEELLMYECTLNGKVHGLVLFDREEANSSVSWLLLFDGRKEVARHQVQDRFYFPGGDFRPRCDGSTIQLETTPGGRTCLHLVTTLGFENGRLHLLSRRADVCDGTKG